MGGYFYPRDGRHMVTNRIPSDAVIIRLCAQGATVAVMAKATRCSSTAIYQRLRRLGLKTRSQKERAR